MAPLEKVLCSKMSPVTLGVSHFQKFILVLYAVHVLAGLFDEPCHRCLAVTSVPLQFFVMQGQICKQIF